MKRSSRYFVRSDSPATFKVLTDSFHMMNPYACKLVAKSYQPETEGEVLCDA